MRPEHLNDISFVQFCMRYTQLSSLEASKLRNSNRISAPPSSDNDFEGILHIVTDDEENPVPLLDFIELQNGKFMKLRKFDAVIRRHKFSAKKDPHEYFYSELLLFWPWRNESELFPDDAEKCVNLFRHAEDYIEVVKATLFPHMADVEIGRKLVEDLKYDMSKIGEDLDAEGEQELDQEAIAELAEEYEGLDPGEFGEMSNVNTEEINAPFFRTFPILEWDSLKEKTRILAWEQMLVLQKIIEYCRDISMLPKTLKRYVETPLIIVHGGAGTGKSTLINVVSLWVNKILTKPGDDPECPYVVIAAPTGMAASNVEGNTLHTTFGFKFGHKYVSLTDKKRDVLRNRFKNVVIIIIDEMSMMNCAQLYNLHLRLCEIKQNNLIMGGIAVFLLGDLMQLKPVKAAHIFEKPKMFPQGVFKWFNIWEQFSCFVLKENHRQGNEKEFANLLERIRFKGKNEKLSEEDMGMLLSRCIPVVDKEKTMKILSTNEDVNAINDQKLNSLDSELHIIEAKHIPSNRKVNLKPSGTIEETAFVQTLKIKVNSRVMLINNVDTSDGLINGAQGNLVGITTDKGSVTRLFIEFDNKNIGQLQRRKFSRCLSAMKSTVTPIEKSHFTYNLGDQNKNHGVSASLLQFPIRLSWAMTCHKVIIH